ncbi:MAG: hypothetical protein P8074_25515 [Anaerolineales bacterium]
MLIKKMSPQSSLILRLVLFCLVILAGCVAPTPSPTVTPIPPLTVTLLYPQADTVLEMGNQLKCIVQVKDARGAPVNDTQVTLTLSDPNGTQAEEIEAIAGDGDAYRTNSWLVPHRVQPGMWSLLVRASSADAVWETSGSFQVKNSISEDLLANYGFWLDAPTLKGIQPSLVAERGDADNGLIRWGGVMPAMHIFPENWVEIHWRKGTYPLDSSEAVRRFLLEELGDLGFTPLREIGAFVPAQFKHWEAWQGKARGEFERYDMQWMVFYAPEVNKTYAIATTVVLPPVEIDAHATLRDSFTIFPELRAQGKAPKPLLQLSPAPHLLSPPLGARFEGLNQPVVLQWEPVKELADDEYYEVVVDFNRAEANIKTHLFTQETQITLPEELYYEPNCHVFNWRVTLKQQTGETDDGRLIGEPETYPSLYWYVLWVYPPDQEQPFTTSCPNAQY